MWNTAAGPALQHVQLPVCAHVYTCMCLHMCALCVHTCYYSHLHQDSFVGGGRNILEETLFLGITDYSHFVWINPVHILHEAGCGMREGIQSRRGNEVGMMRAACREPRTRLLSRRQVRSWAETDTQTWRHTLHCLQTSSTPLCDPTQVPLNNPPATEELFHRQFVKIKGHQLFANWPLSQCLLPFSQ